LDAAVANPRALAESLEKRFAKIGRYEVYYR
jgi:hypothetical protein